jgi:hypothetical protein
VTVFGEQNTMHHPPANARPSPNQTWILSGFAALIALALMIGSPSRGQSFEAPVSSEEDVQDPNLILLSDAASFSKQIERHLASKGARVGIVFRTGRDRDDLPDGIRYTHGAFWVYQPIQTTDGVVNGYAVYNLYNSSDDPHSSYLKQDFPYDFTRGMKIAEAGIIIPTPQMQQRIIKVMASETYAALHQPAYSLISNPHDLRYQNCNEFMLDVVAAALWETGDRAQLKANLKAAFKPAKINTNPIQRIFAPMVDARLVTEDHSGPVRTTTYLSMADFMLTNKLASSAEELVYKPSGAPQAAR